PPRLASFPTRRASDLDRLLVGLEAAERFRVVTININRGTIGADAHAGLFRILLVEAARDQQVKRAGGLAACSENLLFEDFARAVLFTRDERRDLPIGEVRVHVLPGLV